MFRNLKLGYKLIGSFFIMAVIVALTGIIGIRSIDKVSDKVANVMNARAGEERLVLLLESTQKTCRVSLVEASMVRTDINEFKQYADVYWKNRDVFRKYSNALLNGDKELGVDSAKKSEVMEEHAKAVIESWGKFEKVAEKLLVHKAEMLINLRPGVLDAAARDAMVDDRLNTLAAKDLMEVSGFVSRDIDDLSATVEGMRLAAMKDAKNIRNTAIVTFVIVIIGACFVAMLLGLVATRIIVRRTQTMVRAMQEGAEGDLTGRVEVESDDELGKLADDFNTMVAKLSGMIDKVTRSLDEVGKVSNNISDAAKKVMNAAELQSDGVSRTSSAVNQINSSIKEVGHGVDGLSLSASETSSSILEMAASIEEVALNADSLARAVEEVSSSIVEMTASIKQIGGSVTVLMELSTTTASSIAEMDSSIKQVEKNALETATISEEVLRDAERGKSAVDATIVGIGEIKRSSRITSEVIETLSLRADDIGNILQVIDEVAEQTNLLALNAAIIAAQAGEHGKGFAVVADEIKELADRTTSSTREISQVIKGVQDETARAVQAIEIAEKKIAEGERLSQNSGEALNKIFTGVQGATTQAESIARATTEQAKGSQMIRDAVEQVSDMISQIANATREQGKGSELIITAVEQMKGLTGRVRNSTKEQSEVGNFIARSTENITAMIQQIKRACDEQSRGSEQILHSVGDFEVSTQVNLEASRVMNEAVSRLSRQLEVLQKEVASFKTSV